MTLGQLSHIKTASSFLHQLSFYFTILSSLWISLSLSLFPSFLLSRSLFFSTSFPPSLFLSHPFFQYFIRSDKFLLFQSFSYSLHFHPLSFLSLFISLSCRFPIWLCSLFFSFFLILFLFSFLIWMLFSILIHSFSPFYSHSHCGGMYNIHSFRYLIFNVFVFSFVLKFYWLFSLSIIVYTSIHLFDSFVYLSLHIFQWMYLCMYRSHSLFVYWWKSTRIHCGFYLAYTERFK